VELAKLAPCAMPDRRSLPNRAHRRRAAAHARTNGVTHGGAGPRVRQRFGRYAGRVHTSTAQPGGRRAQGSRRRNGRGRSRPHQPGLGSARSATDSRAAQRRTGSTRGYRVGRRSDTVGSPVAKRVNINTATLAELDTLPQIGPATAQRIVDYRTKNGPFKKIEDLKNVSGIGDVTFEALRDWIIVEP